MKRMFAILLACLLVVSLVGCGKDGSKSGTDTLVWAMPLTVQTDSEMVWEEVNKQLAELMPGTELEFMLDSSMSSKWALWMAGKTQVDIALSGYTNDLASEINKKSFYELNDLVKKYAPTVKEEWEVYEKDYQTGMSNGKLYAIPNVQIHVNDEVFVSVPAYLSQYLDTAELQRLAKEHTTSVEAFYVVLDKYMQEAKKHIDTKTTVGLISGVDHFYRNFVKRGYEFIGGNNSLVCYKVTDPDVKVIDFHETEEYKAYVKYAAKWYKEGLISKDILTGDDGIGSLMGIMSANITNFRQYDVDKNGIIDGNAGEGQTKKSYQVSVTPKEQKYNGTAVIGSLKTYCSIPRTAAHPEKAMQLIELLRTDKGAKLLNTIIYGIEGTHYEKLSDTEIKAVDYEGQASSSSKYGLSNWMVSSMIHGMYICYPYTTATYDAAMTYYEEERPNFTKTPVYGMVVDNSKVENELAQMTAANDEFELQLIGGANSGIEDTFNKMQAKIKAAGLEKVIKEYQKQVDDFIKK